MPVTVPIAAAEVRTRSTAAARRRAAVVEAARALAAAHVPVPAG
ncbi:hypothetical protein ACIA8R_43240 [Nonomuraea sp. NPDC051191]